MVTYEEGLKKLGLNKPQHVIYPDPPIFHADTDTDTEGEIPISLGLGVGVGLGAETPTPGLSTGSSRPTPTTAELLSPSKSGRRPLYAREREQSDSPFAQTQQSRQDGSPRTKVGRAGDFPTDSELLTNGVPSYYHQTSAAVRTRADSPPSAYSGTR